MRDTLFAVRKTIEHYANSGYLLIMATVMAFVFANTPLSELYFSLWRSKLSLQIGNLDLLSHHGEPLTIMGFINDALMAIFFFSVGLEIKREVLLGELSSVKKASLPVIAAFGGVILPVIIFSLMAEGNAEMRGAAIPMATDIAFALGILSLFGRRVPIGLKIFLTTLAVVDDILGILAIALFYTETVYYEYLIYVVALLLIIVIGNRLKVGGKKFYLFIGILIWFLFLNSGIHPTISGVLTALFIPACPSIKSNRCIENIISDLKSIDTKSGITDKVLTAKQIDMLKSIEPTSYKIISPLQDIEDALHPLVNYFVIPLFAFANAGIVLGGISTENLLQGVTPAIIVALFVGKFLGIFSFSALAVILKLSSLPERVSWKLISAVAVLGGVGFTVSLFISSLSYSGEYPELFEDAKLGIVIGSLISGITGAVLLKKFLPKDNLHS